MTQTFFMASGLLKFFNHVGRSMVSATIWWAISPHFTPLKTCCSGRDLPCFPEEEKSKGENVLMVFVHLLNSFGASCLVFVKFS